jgi:hypothetical protein
MRSSFGFRMEVLPGYFPEGVVKQLAGGKGWIICCLGCHNSVSQLLLARYKIGSVCPFDASDWWQSL